MMLHDKQYTVSIVIVATVDISTIYSLSVFNLQRSAASVRLWREGEGRGRGHGHLITLACPSADGVNPPVLTTAITAALDGLAENWVSGIYLSGLSSGPKIVRVTSLIPAILPQCNCPSPPCKRDRELFVAITKKSKKKQKKTQPRYKECVVQTFPPYYDFSHYYHKRFYYTDCEMEEHLTMHLHTCMWARITWSGYQILVRSVLPNQHFIDRLCTFYTGTSHILLSQVQPYSSGRSFSDICPGWVFINRFINLIQKKKQKKKNLHFASDYFSCT